MVDTGVSGKRIRKNMKYKQITEAIFKDRPNRFIAHVMLDGKEEAVHVKNTGRCKELLLPGTRIWLEKGAGEGRKTQWDLVTVEKQNRLINLDSQAPNQVAKEWVEAGNLLPNPTVVRPETTFGNSRFDLYLENQERKVFVEVKGVTLEREGVVLFPDAPSERAVKHVEELIKAIKAGYEACILFVIQMEGVKYFTPNKETQPEFAEALAKAQRAGVKILAYDCLVERDTLTLNREVPVILREPTLMELQDPVVNWFRANKRKLPWREQVSAYHVWVSEIMLQQTRVEAVKRYYERFLEALPEIKDLAEAPEDTILKLWEGLGYYNRVRNMQQAAIQIQEEFGGYFPEDYDKIRSLKGIGSYTAGAIASFAFGIPQPAVDGNVLRVLTRYLGSREDIMKAKVRTGIEEALREVIPKEAASDFNQGLIEIGAIVCVPNGAPLCESCPIAENCVAYRENLTEEIPVKKKAKERRIEKKTILLFEDNEQIAIRKRPKRGLLAGLYEFPNLEGYLTQDEVVEYSKSIGLSPIQIWPLPAAKHIFSHVEWQMTGYRIRVDELEKNCTEPLIFAGLDELEKIYPIPSAFEAYKKEAPR